MDWHKKAVELSLKGLNARDISNEIGLDYEKVRGYIKYWRKKNKMSRTNKGYATTNEALKIKTLESTSYNNGEYTFTQDTEKKLSPEDILEQKGFNIAEWEIVSFTSNKYQQQAKGGEAIDLYQSKLTVKPKNQTEITFDDIDRFLENKVIKHTPPTVKTDYNANGDVLEIDIADLHCGLLAWREETGKDEDLKICRDRFLSGIDEIVARNIDKTYKDVYLCALGDIIHIDNDNNTTTKGTVQQADGRIAKIFDFAFETMNEAINKLRILNAKIHYVYLCGNHDRNTGYYLVKCLHLANNDVDFDLKPNPQKAIHFGKCLIGLSHGDMQKKNKGAWLLNDYRKEFGNSDFVEEHCGHFHTEGLQYINGVLVRNVMAQCGNSFWEHTSGYRSLRGIMAFEWDKAKGLKSTQYYYF